MGNKSTASGGIGFIGLLQIAFIVLKLCKVISWSWWVVMLPAIISVGLTVLVLLIALIIAVIRGIHEARHPYKELFKQFEIEEKRFRK